MALELKPPPLGTHGLVANELGLNVAIVHVSALYRPLTVINCVSKAFQNAAHFKEMPVI